LCVVKEMGEQVMWTAKVCNGEFEYKMFVKYYNVFNVDVRLVSWPSNTNENKYVIYWKEK